MNLFFRTKLSHSNGHNISLKTKDKTVPFVDLLFVQGPMDHAKSYPLYFTHFRLNVIHRAYAHRFVLVHLDLVYAITPCALHRALGRSTASLRIRRRKRLRMS